MVRRGFTKQWTTGRKKKVQGKSPELKARTLQNCVCASLRNCKGNKHRGCNEKNKVVLKMFALLLVSGENLVLALSVIKEMLV